MSNLLSVQKEELLSHISHDMYYGLINYMRDLYNGEYDAIVLMARRFSNLYSAMLPLVKAEYFGIVQDEHLKKQIKGVPEKPFIVSDRAIECILADIYRNKDKTRFKHVLLADDIIIHGTTLNKICEQLEEAYEINGVKGYRVETVAYARNEEGSISIKNLIHKEKIEKCNANTWKKISSNFLDILYIMGQSYTSYVPSARISMDTEAAQKIENLISANEGRDITDSNMRRNNVSAYAFSWEKSSNEENFQLFDSYRIYRFPDRRELVLVPMVNLKPIDSHMLDEYYEILSEYITESGQEKLDFILKSGICCGEFKYRVVVYILSALKGLDFWTNYLQLDVNECRYDSTEELLNFSCDFLCDFTCIAQSLVYKDVYSKIQEKYQKGETKIANVSFAEADNSVKKILVEIEDIISNIPANEPHEITGIDLIGKSLQINSRLDEEEFQHSPNRIRITGIPLTYIAQKLTQLGNTIESVVQNILFAIDYGKGSIIPKEFVDKGITVYASVLRAGEQNYRYLIDNYMPVMYGMYLLEKYTSENLALEGKNELWDKYEEIIERKTEFWADDKKYLLEKSMKHEFENILVDEALEEMRNNDKLNTIVEFVNDMLHAS